MAPSLDYAEEYQLISSAKQMNDKNIEDTIASLKGMRSAQNSRRLPWY